MLGYGPLSPLAPGLMDLSTEVQSLSRLQGDLVGRIVDGLVRDNCAVGYHLTEIALSQRFGVSRSPIRSALRYLERQGVLRYEENKGFFLALPASELDRKTQTLPASEEDALYLAITRDRTSKSLPDSFSESDLMRRYDCGKALMSRVLARMSEEGLLSRSKGHGWSFASLLETEEAEFESYRLRILLEPAGLLEPTYRTDFEALKRSQAVQNEVVESGAKNVSSTMMFEINVEFHETLAALSGNRFFLQNMVRQNRLRRLNEYSAFHDSARMVQSCREHLAIIDALLEDNRFWAATLLRQHLIDALNYSGDLRKPPPGNSA